MKLLAKKRRFLSVTQKIQTASILLWLRPKLSSCRVDFHSMQAFRNSLFLHCHYFIARSVKVTFTKLNETKE